MRCFKLKLDIVFKRFFISNSELLRSFLAAILGIPQETLGEIEIVNHNMPADFYNGKSCQLDLIFTVGDVVYNIEMQVRMEKDYMKRTLFYWTKAFTTDLKSGERYNTLKKCVSIHIIDFNFFNEKGEEKRYHSIIKPVEITDGKQVTDIMEIHFLELKKINKKPDKNDMLQVWLNFINAETEEDFDMIKQLDIPVMNKALVKLRELSDDDIIREEVRCREIALHDQASAIGDAMDEGIEIGERKGREEGEKKGIEIGEKKGREEGERKGREEGEKKGREEGREESKEIFIANLRKMGMTEEAIAQAVRGV